MSVSIMDGIRAQMQYDCTDDDPKTCWCRGSGWVLSDWDSFHRCPCHYRGQPHPESEPDEWDYWYDTVDAAGGGQFAVVLDAGQEAERIERAWVYRASTVDEDDDLPF